MSQISFQLTLHRKEVQMSKYYRVNYAIRIFVLGYLKSSIQSEFGTPVSLEKQEMSRYLYTGEMLTLCPCLGDIIFLEKQSNTVNQEHIQMCFYRKCINEVFKSEKLMRFGPPLRRGFVQRSHISAANQELPKNFSGSPISLLENTLSILDVTTALAKY